MGTRRESIIEHIDRMLATEPPRPSLPDNPSCALLAIERMWKDGGDVVLRSIRVRAHEVTQLHCEEVKYFFKPFIDLALANIKIAQQTPKRDTLRITTEDFCDVLSGRDTLRCSDAGYRFRDASFAFFAAVDDETLEKIAPVLAKQQNGPVCLVLLARGLKRYTMGRRKWAARVAYPKKSWLIRAFVLPKCARRLDRMHKTIAYRNRVLLREFVAYHNRDNLGVLRHVCSPPSAFRELVTL